MTKTIRALDEANRLKLTAGYLADMETIRVTAPQSPAMLRLSSSLAFGYREEAAAWVLNALCRRGFYYSGPEFHSLAMSIPIQTWVLGPTATESGKFASWFQHEDRTDYRIIIHRSPRQYNDQLCEEDFFISASWSGRTRPHVMVERRHLFPSQKKEGTEFLEELLAAYGLGPSVVEDLIRDTGHPFWYSHGEFTSRDLTTPLPHKV